MLNIKKIVPIALFGLIIAFLALVYADVAYNKDISTDFVVNNTDLSSIQVGHPGNGQRNLNTTYYTNISPIQIFMLAHANTVGDILQINLTINGTVVKQYSQRPLAAGQNAYASLDAIIPKNSNYSVDASNYHHWEVREYPMLSGRNGTLSYNNNNTFTTNNITNSITNTYNQTFQNLTYNDNWINGSLSLKLNKTDLNSSIDRKLSNYTNDVPFLTSFSESDPIANSRIDGNALNWNATYNSTYDMFMTYISDFVNNTFLPILTYNGDFPNSSIPYMLNSTNYTYLNDINATASDNVIYSDLAEYSTTDSSGTYEANLIYTNQDINGSIRTYFELKSSDGTSVYGQLYINDIAFGIVQTTTELDYIGFTEDFSLSLSGGSKISIYIWSDDIATVYSTNFEVRFDNITQYYYQSFPNTSVSSLITNDTTMLFDDNLNIQNLVGGQVYPQPVGSQYNTIIGTNSIQNVQGSSNVLIGQNTGYNLIGSNNFFMGQAAGVNQNGGDNIGIGFLAGYYSVGYNNIFIGSDSVNNNGAGAISTGSENIYIGGSTGSYLIENDTLRIGIPVLNSTAPLIYGNLSTNDITFGRIFGDGWGLYNLSASNIVAFDQSVGLTTNVTVMSNLTANTTMEFKNGLLVSVVTI